jgi:hypothetical protein
MNDIEVQANVIQEAVNELEHNLPYKELQKSVIYGPICDIRTSVKMLREIASHLSSS